MKKVVDEVIGCWEVQWEASLLLTTEDGKVNLAWEPPTSGPLAPEAPALCLLFNRFFLSPFLVHLSKSPCYLMKLLFANHACFIKVCTWP